MTIRSQAELDGLRAVGRVVAAALDAMEAGVRPGVTTSELDLLAERVLRDAGARSAPQVVYDFPGCACISVNDEIVHGIPGERALCAGDVVKIDVTAELDGLMADAARTVVVATRGGAGTRLAAAARAALEAALKVARAGQRIGAIGHVVEREVRRRGFVVIPELNGHGIGRTIHEEPTVPNFDDPNQRGRLEEGMVITIEPLLSAGSGASYLAPDGWTVLTRDGALAAHHEHTLVITRGAPIVLTAV